MIGLSILTVVTACGAYGKNILDIYNRRTKTESDLVIKYFIPAAILLNELIYAFSREEYTLETIVICIPCILCIKLFRAKLWKEKCTAFSILKRVNTIMFLSMIGILVLMNLII